MIPYISIDRHIERNRATYYTVLRQCSDGKYRSDPTEYKIDYLAWFFIRMMDEALWGIDFHMKKYPVSRTAEQSPDHAFQCFKSTQKKRLQAGEIESETGMNRRTVQRVLANLSEGGFLQVQGRCPARKYQLVF